MKKQHYIHNKSWRETNESNPSSIMQMEQYEGHKAIYNEKCNVSTTRSTVNQRSLVYREIKKSSK